MAFLLRRGGPSIRSRMARRAAGGVRSNRASRSYHDRISAHLRHSRLSSPGNCSEIDPMARGVLERVVFGQLDWRPVSSNLKQSGCMNDSATFRFRIFHHGKTILDAAVTQEY